MPEEIQNSEYGAGLHRSAEDVLSFEVLLQYVKGEITDPVRNIAIKACIENSPLYNNALDGIIAFLDNEGPEALDDLIKFGFGDSFHELMLNIIDQGFMSKGNS